MSWIQKLYETYNNSLSMIGAGTDDNEVSLLPICHTTQKAQIEIVIDKSGEFKRARVIPKDEARTIIPCTESSGGRTSGESAHPLCDKLQYVAADYKEYGGDKTAYHASYVKLLSEWVEQSANKKIQLIYEYVNRGSVISDLITSNVLVADKNKKLLKQRLGDKDKNEGLDIFDLLPGRIDPKTKKIINWQADAFIRWQVEIPNDPQSAVWSDQEIIQSWINFYSSTKEAKALCYVTGEESFSADQHPAKLRNDGDKAKIISSNDSSGFTFRGRFTTAEQAATIGFETTQKAHFALRWLISRQGYRKGDLAIVAWATSGVSIPKPTDDPLSMLLGELPTDAPTTAFTAQDVAVKLQKKIAGYGKEIGSTTDIVVMGLDSASPGRLSITYYRELTGSDFLQRINDWHNSCSWIHYYGSIDIQDEKSGKLKKKFIPFIGAPAPSDMAEAAYATNRDSKFQMDEKLRKATIERILPCIIDGQQIPRDIVESAVRRASNRVALEDWQWNKVLTIACALFKKYNRKENYDMTLDLNRKTRDYLYGRLLALGESLEEWALSKAGEDRPTNAARLMQRFSERPYSTWRTIELALTPYKARLGGKSKKRQRMIDEVVASFNGNEFTSDKRLSGEFLLGYHCQREFLRLGSAEDSDGDDEITETTNNTNS